MVPAARPVGLARCLTMTHMSSCRMNVAPTAAKSHKVSLFDMHMKYGDVIDLSETIAYIESLSSQQHALSAS